MKWSSGKPGRPTLASELGVEYGRHPVDNGCIAVQLCQGAGSQALAETELVPGGSWEDEEPAEGSGIVGLLGHSPCFNILGALDPCLENGGLFLGLRGTPYLVPPRFSHLMLTDVPHICPLCPTGGPAP